jgi:hypothetical protein
MIIEAISRGWSNGMITAILKVGTDGIHAVRRGDTEAHHGGRPFMVHDDIRTFVEANWLSNRGSAILKWRVW